MEDNQKSQGVYSKSAPASDEESPTYTGYPPEVTISKGSGVKHQQRDLVIRISALLLAVSTFTLFSWLAATQQPRPLFSEQTGPLTLDWWRYPIEINAYKRLPTLSVQLNHIFSPANTQHLWAVGDQAIILHSADEGHCWEQQHPVTKSLCAPADALFSLPFLNSARAAESAKDPGQTTFNDYQSQQNARPELPEGKQSGNTAEQSRPLPPILFSNNPRQPSATEVASTNLNQVFFIDSQTGWVVGENGVVLFTNNAGADWQPIERVGNDDLLTISFFGDAGNSVRRGIGVLVARNGDVYNTSDLDGDWTRRNDNNTFLSDRGGNRYFVDRNGERVALLFNAAFFIDANTGWLVGNNGTILHTKNGGEQWQRQTNGTGERLRAVTFVNAQTGWVSGADGFLSGTKDGGKTWETQHTNISTVLQSIQFSDPLKGVAVGTDSTIVTTSDGGLNWRPAVVQTQNPLTSVALANNGQAVAVGDSGTIIGVESLGDRWRYRSAPLNELTKFLEIPDPSSITDNHGIKSYQRSVAPWYYLSWLPISLMLLIAASPKRISIWLPDYSFREDLAPDKELWVKEDVASDRPLNSAAEDKLGFVPISKTLSSLLRNKNTEPPLTIAVSGQWGSGKSSLMNLLQEDLKRAKFEPVWFNAWHHQKEEHILAAMLENIRQQAIPSVFSLIGFVFRWRILRERILAHRLKWSLITGLLLFVSIFYWLYISKISEPSITGDESFKGLIAFISNPLAGGATSLTLMLGLVMRGLKAFGVNPAQLAKVVTKSNRDITRKMSYRFHFAQDFAAVADALRPRTMLIFIDDLDRCRPDVVVEVLEAVNFLTSSGKCYVVMGMAREIVEPSIGLAFKEIAEEKSLYENGDEVEAGIHTRREYAGNYLEKLINLEIKVPEFTRQKTEKMLDLDSKEDQLNEEDAASASISKPEKWRDQLNTVSNVVIIAICFIAIVYAATTAFNYLENSLINGKQIKEDGKTIQVEDIQKPSDQINGEDSSQTKTSNNDIKRQPEKGDTVILITTDKIADQTGPLKIGFIIFLGLAMIAVRQWAKNPEEEDELPPVEEDTQDFQKALTVWMPIISYLAKTPRQLKQLINQLRYLTTRINILKTQYQSELAINEPQLVAFILINQLGKDYATTLLEAGSLEEFYASLAQEAGWQAFDGAKKARKSDKNDYANTQASNFPALLDTTITEHLQRFGNWIIGDEQQLLQLNILQNELYVSLKDGELVSPVQKIKS